MNFIKILFKIIKEKISYVIILYDIILKKNKEKISIRRLVKILTIFYLTFK